MDEYRDEYTSKLRKVTTPSLNNPTKKKAAPKMTEEIFEIPSHLRDTDKTASKLPVSQDKPAVQKKKAVPPKKKPVQQKKPQVPRYAASDPNRQTGKKKSGKGRIVALSLFFAAALIIIFLVARGGGSSSMKTGFVQNGTLEKSSDGTAVFLRAEQTVATDTDGKMIAGINEGERVAKGEVVAYVVDDQMEETVEELKKVEDRILAAQTYSDSMVESISSSLNEISNAVTDEIVKLMPESSRGKLRSFSDIKSTVETYFELKNDMTMNVETKDSYVLSLQSKRTEILNRLQGHMHALTAPEAGVVSYYLDGRENTVSAMDFENVSASAVADMDTNGTRTVGKSVKKGETVFRITSANEYYIAVTLDGKTDDIKRNAAVTVQADDHSFKAAANVLSVESNGDGHSFVLLKSASNMAGTISYRTKDVNVIFEAVAGLKVPVNALTDWDTAGLTAKITLIRSNYVEGVYVNVASYNDEYAIITNQTAFDSSDGVKGVQANDMYVLNPESVKEGEMISK